MKKVLIAGLLVIGMVFSVFAASTVSWEGRAAVGSSGVFPGRGMYALSRVFSTGEIVEVYNPVNQKKVTVVISNNTDLSGILVLLSPEAAEALSIVSGSDSVVRVSKIPEYALQGSTEETSEEVTSAEESEDILVEELVVEETTAEIEEESVDEVENIADVAVVDETVTEEIVSYSLLPAEELPPEPSDLDVLETDTTEISTIDNTIFEESIVEETVSSETGIYLADDYDSDIEKELALQGQEIAMLKAELAALEEELLLAREDVVASQDSAVESLKAEIKAQEQTIQNLQNSLAASGTTATTYSVVSSGSYGNYVKPLQAGSYYVQFAFLADRKNIDSMLKQYNRYPLVLNEKDNGYQMLVGPLAASEYKAVEAQFKSFGFRDTFSRKIQ